MSNSTGLIVWEPVAESVEVLIRQVAIRHAHVVRHLSLFHKGLYRDQDVLKTMRALSHDIEHLAGGEHHERERQTTARTAADEIEHPTKKDQAQLSSLLKKLDLVAEVSAC